MKNIFILSFLFFFFSCGTSEEKSASGSEETMPSALGGQENPYQNANIEIKTFRNDTVKSSSGISGFGYNIYLFDALYVHQPHIPAVSGNRGFKSEEDARKAAELVAYKIRNNIMPPSLTVQELDSLDVLK